MEHDLRIWKRLYELTDQIRKLKPWEYMWSDEFVCIELEPEQYSYCTIMGKNKKCIGISVYKGDEGYEDLCSVSHEYPDIEITKYIMYEQRCLTWYLGDNDEVPRDQKRIMKELGIRYRGHNQWPYFLSFEPRYYPVTFNVKEAKYFLSVLERLVDVLRVYIYGDIDVDFERSEMIFAHIEDGKWVYESMSLPDKIDKFSPVELEDRSIFKELKAQELTHDEIYIDLFYLNNHIKDNNFMKPINPLMFLVVDKRSESIIYGDLLSPDHDEIEIILNFLIQYILGQGIPQTVYFRNPGVYCSIVDICETCGIEMKIDHFSLVNEIIEGIARAI